jgi:glycerol uptake facilitator-like aquaporin
MQAFLAEFIATFFLSFVVWGTAADPRAKKVGGLAIGLTIAADIMAIGTLTGGSMNPARSFGPTLVGALTGGKNLWSHAWLYWLAPAAGSALAALIYNTFLWPRDEAAIGSSASR